MSQTCSLGGFIRVQYAQIPMEPVMPEFYRQSGSVDLNIEDGVDYSFTAIYKVDGVVQPIDGYSAAFTLRNKKGSSTTLLALTEGAGITVTGVQGKVKVDITKAESAFGSRAMVYDLTITSPAGITTTLLRGVCKSWSASEV